MPRGIKCRFWISSVTQITDIMRNGYCRLRSYRRVDIDLRVNRKDLVMDQSTED